MHSLQNQIMLPTEGLNLDIPASKFLHAICNILVLVSSLAHVLVPFLAFVLIERAADREGTLVAGVSKHFVDLLPVHTFCMLFTRVGGGSRPAHCDCATHRRSPAGRHSSAPPPPSCPMRERESALANGGSPGFPSFSPPLDRRRLWLWGSRAAVEQN